MRVTRRQFLGSGAAIAAGAMAPQKAFAANDRINIALIGCGHRGRMVAGGLMSEGAHLSYICDLHPQRLEETRHFLSQEQETEFKLVKNMDEVMADDAVDAVVVATPDHWHALPTVRACQAGKDVYVEKIHSHNIFESQKMAEAAAKYDRIVQVGTQNRSAPYIREARKRIEDGVLGDIPLVKVFNLLPGNAFTLGEQGEPPEGFDWNTYVGRTPTEWPYYERIFRGGWMQFWDFSGGQITLDAIHQIDLALQLLGDPGLPKDVRCLGGRWAHPDDDAEVPDVQLANWDFGDFVLAFDQTTYPDYVRKTDRSTRGGDDFPYWPLNSTRIELYGSDLFMYVGRHGGGWIIKDAHGEEIESMPGRVPDLDHYADFLKCVRSREKPNADISVAHASNVLVHMATISHRMGNVALGFRAESETFENEEANQYIRPPAREEFEVPVVV